MGSLKDEMRGLTEDHKPCERGDDGERPGGSDGGAEPEGPQINMSQESSTLQSYQPKVHLNACYDQETDKDSIPKDEEDSGEVCDQSEEVKDSEEICPTQQLEATKDTQNNTEEFLMDGDDSEIQEEASEDKTAGPDKKDADIETITIPVPPTPGPCEPCTPAPFGQHHMRTQVSLEVVQCHSAATSPMTPPQDGQSFFFPSSFGRSATVGSDTKDAELQVGRLVELCSVATSPMTPKTPYTTAFPELTTRDMVQRSEERVNQREGQDVETSSPQTKNQAGAELEKTADLKLGTQKEQSEGSDVPPESSTCCPATRLTDSGAIVGDSNEQCKQQRMGSVDQDITILVTHHGNTEEEEGEEDESLFNPSETEMAKIDESEETGGEGDVKRGDEEKISTDAVDHAEEESNSAPAQEETGESSAPATEEAKQGEKCGDSEVKDRCEDVSDVFATKPAAVPESPAPFGCHNIRTQVSLEVVQCQSAATSPMTPPEGDQAFCFPSSRLRCEAVGAETKDAELQVGQQVEYRSVATAPMTPRTPIATTFPEVRKETSIEEKIVEEEEEKKEDEKKMREENMREERNCKEKCEEPVQEVSWDEKGMTWEVYGAVVEVTVLGSAIQKHLEKQVRKQKLQPSMHPPPPLNPSAMHLTTEGTHGGSGLGKGKRGVQDGEEGRRRRNPFRQLMENMQQPHCCSRAHSAE
ncbi:uncharacterized protein gprin1 [Halichoeres trimaculatus]|uniref:uncharacterized protein gprin1 n=1 Tax=Halichoeres trimaculatus TaxID=147232 RepID=UPI003D9DB5F4